MRIGEQGALDERPLAGDLEAAVRQATGLVLGLVPVDGPTEAGAFGTRQNPFCRLVTRTAGGCAACLRLQRQLCDRVRREPVPQMLKCFAGMTVVAVPVQLGGLHVATWLGGQVFEHKPTRRQFARVARQLRAWGLGRQLREAEKTYLRTGVVPAARLRGVLRLLSFAAQQLANSVNRRALARPGAMPPSVTQAKDYVLAHLGNHLTECEVARQSHVSPFYLSRVFKSATGMHFMEYVARGRVEKAKRLLRDPAARVSEVAFECGFGSIPNFNRVFKKYTSLSPSQYRARQQP